MTRPRVMAWFWSLVVFALHSIPRARLLELPGGEKFIATSDSDKAAHVVLFGIFAFLWSRCFGKATRQRGERDHGENAAVRA